MDRALKPVILLPPTGNRVPSRVSVLRGEAWPGTVVLGIWLNEIMACRQCLEDLRPCFYAYQCRVLICCWASDRYCFRHFIIP